MLGFLWDAVWVSAAIFVCWLVAMIVVPFLWGLI